MKPRVTILISDKIDFKTKTVKRGKEGYYIMMKGSVQQEVMTLVNNYAPKRGVSKYIKPALMNIKGDSTSNRIIAWNFNTPNILTNRSFGPKINKEHWPEMIYQTKQTIYIYLYTHTTIYIHIYSYLDIYNFI